MPFANRHVLQRLPPFVDIPVGTVTRSAEARIIADTSYRVGQKQLMFDGATERFTNSEAANALLKPAYRKHYRIPNEV